MAFAILLTEEAAADLREIYNYIARHDSHREAEHVLDRIENKFNSLAEQPGRGAYLKELITVGIHEFREIFFKPYRIIYRMDGEKVFVYLIADGGRDMQNLLQRRLLGA